MQRKAGATSGQGHLQPSPRRAVLGVTARPARAAEQEEEVDVIVVGAGFGGLAAAGLLARTGRSVLVCESHSVPGGVAHAFSRQGYEFDSGPSLLSGVSSPRTPNPLRHVLNALGEDCEWVTYPGWRVVGPDGDFDFEVGDAASWEAVVRRFGGAGAVAEWRRLLELAVPLGEASKGVPAAALRGDFGAAATLGRFLGRLPPLLLNGLQFQAPFADLMRKAGVRSPFLRRWLDYICFVLQALPAETHPTAPVAYMLSDMHAPGAALDYPRGGGMGELVQALARGVERHGGRIRYGVHVDGIELRWPARGWRAPARRWPPPRAGGCGEQRQRVGHRAAAARGPAHGGRAGGCRGGAVRVLHAPAPRAAGRRGAEGPAPPLQRHPQLGGGDRLGGELRILLVPIHDSGATGNVVIISVPSVVNPALAPPGRHCVHAYLAATEPFELWEGLRRGTPEYEALKRDRARPLFEAVERAIPGATGAIELELVGSPLTHARFCRRHRGTYGPLAPSAAGMLPGAKTSIEGLLCCGDSTFPGIGVPAAAASGCAAAAVLMSVEEHLEVLDAMDIP
ncbi:unnamed protein product [Prorocentrum cordatum]|uniref:Prolycopene isomerase n=1 Tax=Prorocentrum cordatum TaxID=2364126 RepID=A0ABN9XHV0_9DINO|nr:unnamed protein product [Polarella glacialis]